TFTAVAINFSVALAAIGLAKVTPHTPQGDDAKSERVVIPAGSWPIYIAIALSGASALGAEVGGARLLSLMLGATVYTFSVILAAFLVGLGIGSSVGAFAARTVESPRAVLGWCQFLLIGGLAWAGFALARGLPFWPINPELSTSPSYTFQID